MSDIAIRVENLAKQYHIGSAQRTFNRFGDQVAHMAMAPLRRAGKLLRGQATGAAELDETIWALQDVSFEIKCGEVVGIIGRNGAGKSTLLKILSCITEPTAGSVDIYGRVGSLLEVGTGFHPELTGRENIFLNGSILGMRKQEIERKFDEIVEFAEIERFIDTPVKHYSSGMYVRLAFSIAAHLEPEILLIDEVLAVGDLAFQRKCLGKMDDVAQHGRTVLFVSHNMSLVQTLCQRGIVLQEGAIIKDSGLSDAVDAYMQTLDKIAALSLAERTDRQGVGGARVTQVEITNCERSNSDGLKSGDPVRFTFHVNAMIPELSCLFVILDHLGRRVAMFQSDLPSPRDVHDESLGLHFECELRSLLLLPGRYRINVLLRDPGGRQDFIESAVVFDVTEGRIDERPMKALNNGISVSIPHRWRLPTT